MFGRRLSGWRSMIALLGICGVTSGGASARENRIGNQVARAIALDARAPIAFDAQTLREPLWTVAASEMQTRADAGPAVFGDGTVFSGQRFGPGEVLGATDVHAAKTVWSSDLIGTPAALSGDTVLAVAQEPDGPHAVALDSRTGRQRWNVVGTSVALIRQLAIVTNGLHLEARDARSGALRWSAAWNGYSPHDVRLIGRTLLLHTFESGAIIVGELYAYDALDGRPLWTKGNVNAIVGVDGERSVTVDVTWDPSALANYAPLTTDTIALRDGSGNGPHAFAPDPSRWQASADTSVHFAQDVATDAGALVLRIGATTVYRYAQLDAPDHEPPARYELGAIARAGNDTWLARLPDGGAGVVHLDPAHASLQRLSGLDGIEFAGVYDGLALVAGRDRAVIFDPLHPANAVASHFACGTVTNAFRGDGVLVAVCSKPRPRLIALAIPASAIATAPATPLPIQPQTRRSFDAKFEAHGLPTKFAMTRGAAFSGDGTLWFCEHALFTSGIMGHTDFIGRLTRGGGIDKFAVPTVDANVVSIVRGPDGAMWFTEASAVKLGRIAADGTITEYALPAELDRNPVFPYHPIAGSSPHPVPTDAPGAPRRVRSIEKLGGIAAGPDGALWLTAPYANAVARVSPTGDVHIFTLPSTLHYPGNITRGPDAALWIATRDSIARLAPDGEVRTYSLPTSRGIGLTSLIWAADGNLWFSFFDGRAGRITPRGEIRIFSGPVVAAPSGPLVGGCDGALYLADRYRPALWRLTTAGEFVEHDAPFAIHSLARAPDCTLGATESQAPANGHVATITLGQR